MPSGAAAGALLRQPFHHQWQPSTRFWSHRGTGLQRTAEGFRYGARGQFGERVFQKSHEERLRACCGRFATPQLRGRCVETGGVADGCSDALDGEIHRSAYGLGSTLTRSSTRSTPDTFSTSRNAAPSVVFVRALPVSVIESGRIDGASHFQTFWRLILPMSVPALASFAIFQFLWVWNDLFVALVFIGPGENSPMTVAIQNNLLSQQGQGWNLVTAGGFFSMVVPIIVFLSLQRFFVRGLTAGAVKG